LKDAGKGAGRNYFAGCENIYLLLSARRYNCALPRERRDDQAPLPADRRFDRRGRLRLQGAGRCLPRRTAEERNGRRSSLLRPQSQERRAGYLLMSAVRATIDYLRRCQHYRAAGGLVSFTTDPAWLVHMAINRRAGWPDDPDLTRGSARPVNGRYPKRASGDNWVSLRRFARNVNTPRLRVSVRECPARYRARLERRLDPDYFQ
jgi:hypothetical protein